MHVNIINYILYNVCNVKSFLKRGYLIFVYSLFPLKGIINKVSLGDLSSGRAFDNGCTCFYSCQGVVNDLRGQKTDCFCNVSSVV